jgi:hypothetical protein
MAEALKACLVARESKVLPPEPTTKRAKHPGLVVFVAFIVVSVAGGFPYYFMAKEKQDKDESPSGVKVARPGVLKVDSVPAGAQVFLDGSFQGKTPLTLELPFGKYEVRLSLPDYYEGEAQLQLNEEGEPPLFCRLIRNPDKPEKGWRQNH